MHKLNEHLHQYVKSSDEAYEKDSNFALKDRKAIKNNIEKSFKEVNKTHDEFIKINNKKDAYGTMKTKDFKKMHLDEGIFATAEKPVEKDEFWYDTHRGSLLDIITSHLTGDERVYRRHETDDPENPKFVVQYVGLSGIANEDIAVNYGDDGRASIKVRVADDNMVDKVVALANRYHKETAVKPTRYYGDKKFEVTIYMDESDFEDDYHEAGINIKPVKKRGPKARTV